MKETVEDVASRNGGTGVCEADGCDEGARDVFVGWPCAGTAVRAPLDEVREDEVIACVVERVADQLAMTFWTVNMGQTGDEWLNIDLTRRDSERVGLLCEGESTAIQAPVC